MIDLEAIKRAAEAATPGPWVIYSSLRETLGTVPTTLGIDSSANEDEVVAFAKVGSGGIREDRDAEHIASANPAAVLELIARLETAERDNAMLRRLLAVSASGSDLYTDDGELTDASEKLLIDYKRDAVEEIEQKLRCLALYALAEINTSLGLKD